MAKILIIEDDTDINNMIAEYLSERNMEVEQAFSGTEGKLLWQMKDFDLLILDLMLPGMSGEELTAWIRKSSQVPIIVLTAKDALENKIELLGGGADDYLTKPFALEELWMRVQVQLRHVGAALEQKTISYKEWTIDLTSMCLRVHGETINLTAHEFAIVELFMRRPKKVFTKQEIYETIWQQVRIQQERASNELKYTISCISHDIRTPLTGAAGYLELLLKTTDPIKQKKYETIIQERLQDLEKMLDELFLYTKLSQQEYSLECSPIQPFPILCEVMADYYERITNSGLEPNISFLEESVEFLAEPESLKRIFRNLIQNAISYGSEYLIIEQKEERILFRNRVQTGESIDITRIFDRFYKADHSRHDKSSGLGLSIVKQLMEKMGGMVDAALDNEELVISLAFRK